VGGGVKKEGKKGTSEVQLGIFYSGKWKDRKPLSSPGKDRRWRKPERRKMTP